MTCRRCGKRGNLEVCKDCRAKQDPRDDPSEAGLPSPEGGETYDYWDWDA